MECKNIHAVHSSGIDQFSQLNGLGKSLRITIGKGRMNQLSHEYTVNGFLLVCLFSVKLSNWFMHITVKSGGGGGGILFAFCILKLCSSC